VTSGIPSQILACLIWGLIINCLVRSRYVVKRLDDGLKIFAPGLPFCG
jgi:hypothetical protein